MTSRKVALTAAFLTLAAGGTAACDTTYDDYDDSTYAYDSDGNNAGPGSGSGSGSGSDTGADSSDEEQYEDEDDSGDDSGDDAGDDEEQAPVDEVFYCADEDGEIVDEDLCADADETSSFFLYHSPFYAHGLKPGTYLDGGDSFSAGDRATRRAFKLPPTGKVGNGTVKTNVVGRGSTGSGLSSGTSGG
ncbi:hypothetical protein AB0C29_29620 [Actinoplanes sp. NPDC048791]|uniref:hypothetical protein n=1 Tax=Actinoplanes sp. NPDC048791 TaxID=3154623 RepID=UPI0033D1B2FF